MSTTNGKVIEELDLEDSLSDLSTVTQDESEKASSTTRINRPPVVQETGTKTQIILSSETVDRLRNTEIIFDKEAREVHFNTKNSFDAAHLSDLTRALVSCGAENWRQQQYDGVWTLKVRYNTGKIIKL